MLPSHLAIVTRFTWKGIKWCQKSLITFQTIAYRCLSVEREERPTAREVALQLKKALEFQEDFEIWEAKLQSDYKEIMRMLKCLLKHKSKRSQPHVLQRNPTSRRKSGSNGEINETLSATKFSYGNNSCHKWRTLKKSR
ncbi:hypothetical protein Hanom_Chr12g01162331 [Helianthus anomalus]